MREDAWDMVGKALGGLRFAVKEATWAVEEGDDPTKKIVACEAVVEQFSEFQIAFDKAIWASANVS